jgi:hypothetical protein
MLKQNMLKWIITLFVIEWLKKKIQIHFISSKNQLVDVLTKPLSPYTFAPLHSKLHVDNPPSALDGVL